MVDWVLKKARRLVITVIGFTVLGIGVAMIVLPGPAIVVIPIGLGILASEFLWARHLLKRAKTMAGHIRRGRARYGRPTEQQTVENMQRSTQ